MAESNETEILPDGLISYGPDANCTLDLCLVEWSVLQYQPSLTASGVFIGLFVLAMVLHIIQGLRCKAWSFMICVVLGCIDEVIGYGGRILLNQNPFSFAGFLMNMICITTAPVFYCAAIYVTLSRTIEYLDRSLSRFNPKLLYWAFIPADVISLALQAGGGASSSLSSGSSTTGLQVSQAGLSIQVITIVIFVGLGADYLVRYFRRPGQAKMSRRFRTFLFSLSASILFILGRCVYRIDELREGYRGLLFSNEELFYGFESILIVIAVFCLNLGHPGVGMPKDKDGEPGTKPEASSNSEVSDPSAV